MSAASSDALIRRPHPRLRAFVGDYVGYDITGAAPGTHIGLPSGMLTFIVSIDAPLHQLDEASNSTEAFDVLLAGLHLRPTLIPHTGTMTGIQINVDPRAPRSLFGLPAGAFAHRSLDLSTLSRSVAVELHDRVNAARTWAERFDSVDDVLMRTLGNGRQPRAEVRESWRHIARSHGAVSISQLADRIGWSRRYLSSQFQAEYGIGPKEAARIIRFDRARRMVSAGIQPLAEIAAVCGYADQSHLNRDFRALAGTSPRHWLDDDDVARTFVPEDLPAG